MLPSLALVLLAASPDVAVPPLAGFACVTRAVKNDALDLNETRCTQSGAPGATVVLEARLYRVVDLVYLRTRRVTDDHVRFPGDSAPVLDGNERKFEGCAVRRVAQQV